MKKGLKAVVSLVMMFVLSMGSSAQAITSKAPVPPTIGNGSYKTGVYRNVFVEGGITDAKTSQNKLNEMWNTYFKSNDPNYTKRIYHEIGSDMAAIHEKPTDDVITEGQSYGMMICVQMNKKDEFDKLWKFAKTYMYRSSGQYKGYFSNKVSGSGKIVDEGPAPDGEEYFAAALFMAGSRWGNGSGIFNYANEANSILNVMLHQQPDGCPTVVDLKNNQIKFAPYCNWTDPSYHVPAFYDYFALKSSSKTDQVTWGKMATTSRQMWLKFAPGGTGLNPCYATFDGKPYDDPNVNHGYGGNFKSDAYRTVMNAAVDYSWWAANSNEITYANNVANWFNSKLKENKDSYPCEYSMDGTALVSYESNALYACNATVALACNSGSWNNGYGMADKFWRSMAYIPTGDYRYWNGLISMLGMLHLTGNFKIYK